MTENTDKKPIVTRREFLMVVPILGSAACGLVSISETSSGDTEKDKEVRSEGKLRLMVDGVSKLVEIRYAQTRILGRFVKPLTAPDAEIAGEGVYSYKLTPFAPGEKTRRTTGELLDSRLRRVVLAAGAGKVELVDTPGGSPDPANSFIGTLEEGKVYYVLPVITAASKKETKSMTLFEINDYHPEGSVQPYAFTEGGAVGHMMGDTFFVEGYFHKTQDRDVFASAPASEGANG